MLFDFAKNDKDSFVRLAAVARLTDKNALAYIVINEKGREHRWKAFKKLTDQETPDEKLLEKIAQGDPDYSLRLEAINRLTNQQVLAELVKTATCTGVYAAFAELVKEEFSSPDGDKWTGWEYVNQMRHKAVLRLTDQDALVDLVCNYSDDRGSDWQMRKEALKRLQIT